MIFSVRRLRFFLQGNTSLKCRTTVFSSLWSHRSDTGCVLHHRLRRWHDTSIRHLRLLSRWHHRLLAKVVGVRRALALVVEWRAIHHGIRTTDGSRHHRRLHRRRGDHGTHWWNATGWVHRWSLLLLLHWIGIHGFSFDRENTQKKKRSESCAALFMPRWYSLAERAKRCSPL